jgi:hypothetical protein
MFQTDVSADASLTIETNKSMNRIPRHLLTLLILTICLTQEQPAQVDQFGKIINDDLMARVDQFQEQLEKSGSVGFVILHGSTLSKYLNKRRIEGCNLWRRNPVDSFKFVFAPGQDDVSVEFWLVPKGFSAPKFTPTILDYKLPNLKQPLELTKSMATDEYCPTYFDLDWYADFLNANRRFTGRVVIDVKSEKVFRNRVYKYRKELFKRGISPSRIRYFRRHFNGERDEQFWLVPHK